MKLIRTILVGAGLAMATGPAASAEEGDEENAPEWRMVWSDEFDGADINGRFWNVTGDCWGGGNEERQCYTGAIGNSHIEEGKLVITARKQSATGPAWPEQLRDTVPNPDAQATKPYTSAKLTTKGKVALTYGKIEVRAKLPQGQGTWPAIWMLPEDDEYGTWAASGEIDILEAINLGVECKTCEEGGENTILGTLHFGGRWPDNKHASTEVSKPEVLDGFHTYGVIWEPGRFRWTLNGEVYAEKVASDWSTTGSDEANAPFDKPFYLILNLAIGGKLPEGRAKKGVSGKGFPKHLEVDWVRIWQCEDPSASADKCGI